MSALVHVPVAHLSGQFSDSPQQRRKDAVRLFRRERHRHAWWVTGTEASNAGTRADLEGAAHANGFRIHIRRESWVAISREHIEPGSWRTGYEAAIESSDGYGRHSDRGVTWAEAEDAEIGIFGVAASHLLTRGRPDPKNPAYKRNLDENLRIMEEVDRWGRAHGRGKALAFYQADQNIDDKVDDALLGAGFETMADELRTYAKGRLGKVDVLSSWKNDGRVTAHEFAGVPDSEVHFFSDHTLLEGSYDIEALS